jgi:hypothetical protein
MIHRKVRRGLAILAGFACAQALPRLAAQVTESPFTVAPGSLRVEMDGLRLSLDREDRSGATYNALAVASTFVTAGLAEAVDVQIGADLFLRERVEYRGSRDSSSGLGDLSMRMKWTVWRDARLGAALAVMPYVKLPSGSGAVGTDAVEGGVIVPWAAGLPGGVVSGAMFRWDVVRNDAENGYDSRWLATGYLQRHLTGALAVYGEATLQAASTGASNTAGTLGVGALLQVTRRLQLDYELQRGLNRRASEWTHVLRVNWDW